MGSLRIIQITDFHLAADSARVLRQINTDHSLRRVLAHISAHEPHCALLLATGDLADDGSPQAYQRIATYLRQADIPICCLPGNHDDAVVMARRLTDLGINTLQTVNLDGWRLIPLDSTVG
ncbi:MAG: phosphodiesterase, partial [Gammaproteobacteria bacterium]